MGVTHVNYPTTEENMFLVLQYRIPYVRITKEWITFTLENSRYMESSKWIKRKLDEI